MKYIIFDMEWNQPSYSGKIRTVRGVRLTGEIVQIGAVRTDAGLNVEDCFSVNIEPVFYKKMNRNVRKITGITDDELRGCPRFDEALEQFLEFCGRDCVLLTWGRDDLPMLRDNMQAFGMETDDLPPHYDLQVIYGDQIAHQRRQWSLSGAMETMEIEQKYTAHNALYDAINTAKVAMRLELRSGIENYGRLTALDALGSQSETFEGFRDLKSALADQKLCRFVCPVCQQELHGGAWIGTRGKRMALAECPEHGMLRFGLCAFQKGAGFAVTRKVTPANADVIASYGQKMAAVK